MSYHWGYSRASHQGFILEVHTRTYRGACELDCPCWGLEKRPKGNQRVGGSPIREREREEKSQVTLVGGSDW